MKIYIDTDVLSNIASGKWYKKEDGKSLSAISELYPKSFCLSETLTLQEIQEIKNISDPELKNKVKEIYNRINKVSIPSLSYGGGSSTQDPDRTKLRKIFTPEIDKSSGPKSNYITHFQNRKGKRITVDADHIYYSFKSGCDFFLTVDRDTIMRRYYNNKSEVDRIISPTKIVVPPTLLNLLNVVN